jgi:16S rRNA (adenine1518-N6/adenine1519-N6)-dimethyltransferase
MKLLAKKSLGQHFLNSPHVLSQIIDAGKIKSGENILEIGPGTGILTRGLLDSGAKVTAVEKDDRAITILSEKFKAEIEKGQLKLINSDILEENASLIPQETYKIIANIPYYITGAILEKFLENGNKPQKMVLLVQKEVADRILAKDGKESILSISVKAFGTPKIIAKVPKGAFLPPPTVDSAILAIENINNSNFGESSLEVSRFFEIIRAGFAHKRKFLIRNLEVVIEDNKLKNIWSKLKLDEKIRAEDISCDKWILIAKEINK